MAHKNYLQCELNAKSLLGEAVLETRHVVPAVYSALWSLTVVDRKCVGYVSIRHTVYLLDVIH